MMKSIFLCALVAVAVPFVASAETWKNVPASDSMCYEKVKADPDAHSTKCALACARSGYGIIAADGSFLKFDEAGNARFARLLKDTKNKDHLRVTVDGDRAGDSIKVKSLSLN